MGLRFDPMGGGKFKAAVEAIMQAESQPVRQLENRKAKVEKKVETFQKFRTAFNELASWLDGLSSYRQFRELKVDTGIGKDLVDVTIDKDTAETGSWQLLVDEMAQRNSVISNGFEDPSEPMMGIGFIVMHREDGSSYDIWVPEEEGSLNGVAALINSDKEAPVRASVIKDDWYDNAPFRLLITSKKEGDINDLNYPDFYFLDPITDFYLEDERESQNAYLEVDGFEIETEGNKVPNFLKGVNLHLLAADPDKPFMLSITEDIPKIAEKVAKLVEKINAVLKFVNEQNAIDDRTDTSVTFAGDTSLQSIEFSLRNQVHRTITVGDPEEDDEEDLKYLRLSELGIRFQRDGLLKFDENKFKQKLEADFETVAQAITHPVYGFANTLRKYVKSYTTSLGGLLSVKEKGLQSRIKNIDNNIETKNRYLKNREKSLVDKFSRLQATLGQLQSQQQYMTAALGAPAGAGIAQLLG